MQDAVAVRVVESGRAGIDDAEDEVGVEAPATPEQRLQGGAVDVLHDEARAALEPDEVVEADDVRLRELHRDARLGLHRAHGVLVVREVVAEDLDGHVEVEHVVARLRDRLGPERVWTGRFGADMKVRLLNDGPFSVELVSGT